MLNLDTHVLLFALAGELRPKERDLLSRIPARDLAGFEAVMAAVAEVTRVVVRDKAVKQGQVK